MVSSTFSQGGDGSCIGCDGGIFGGVEGAPAVAMGGVMSGGCPVSAGSGSPGSKVERPPQLTLEPSALQHKIRASTAAPRLCKASHTRDVSHGLARAARIFFMSTSSLANE